MSTSKDTIVSWSIPDYSAGLSYTGGSWTLAPYDCFFTGGAASGDMALCSSLYIADDSSGTNSVRIAYDYAYAVTLNGFCPKGKYFKCSASNYQDLKYYPLQGIS